MEAEQICEYVRRRILDIRKGQRLPAKQVAAAAGICQSSYSSIETGAFKPTIVSLYRIAQALRVDMAELFPCVWEAWFDTPHVTCLPEMDRHSAFRVRELRLLSEARGVGLVLAKGNRAEVLSWIDLSEHAPGRLLAAIVRGETPEGWLVLREEQDSTAMYLCLYRAQLEDYVEKLARKYLRLWLYQDNLSPPHLARKPPSRLWTEMKAY